jgi:polyisoprenoid-binding protein YceI
MLSSLIVACLVAGPASGADYIIDTEGAHAFVNFKFRHLGYSILTGTFEKFEGEFSWDPDTVSDSRISITIDTKSLNSYHAERDRHMRGDKYLDTGRFPEARFVSTDIEDKGAGAMVIRGDLTLRGVTREIAIDARRVGEGNDPWGDYRAGFEGYVTIDMRDFGVNSFIPLHTVDMELFVEGIRQ